MNERWVEVLHHPTFPGVTWSKLGNNNRKLKKGEYSNRVFRGDNTNIPLYRMTWTAVDDRGPPLFEIRVFLKGLRSPWFILVMMMMMMMMKECDTHRPLFLFKPPTLRSKKNSRIMTNAFDVLTLNIHFFFHFGHLSCINKYGHMTSSSSLWSKFYIYIKWFPFQDNKCLAEWLCTKLNIHIPDGHIFPCCSRGGSIGSLFSLTVTRAI